MMIINISGNKKQGDLAPLTSCKSFVSRNKHTVLSSCWLVCVSSGGGGVLVPVCVFGAPILGPSASQHRAQCLMSGVDGRRF